jgi:hypothetical protein
VHLPAAQGVPGSQTTPMQLFSTQRPFEQAKSSGQVWPPQVVGRHRPSAQVVPAAQVTPTHAEKVHVAKQTSPISQVTTEEQSMG